VSKAIIYIFLSVFFGVFKKNENSIFRKKMTIFLQKNAIFIFFKTPIKSRTKKKNYCFRHFFHFFYFVLKKIKIKKTKVGQKLSKKVGSLSSFTIKTPSINK
jgi:hypothetical protein